MAKAPTHPSTSLVRLSAGHDLFISQNGHPLATGAPWEDVDVLMALFIFSHPSRLLFTMIADDTLQAEFLLFVDAIPADSMPKIGTDVVSHWMKNRPPAHGKTLGKFRIWLSGIFRHLTYFAHTI